MVVTKQYSPINGRREVLDCQRRLVTSKERVGGGRVGGGGLSDR